MQGTSAGQHMKYCKRGCCVAQIAFTSVATALRFYVSDLKAGRRYHIHHGVIEKAQGSAPNDPSTFVLGDHFAIATEGKSLKERMEDLARWCRENLVIDASSEVRMAGTREAGPISIFGAYERHCTFMGNPRQTGLAVDNFLRDNRPHKVRGRDTEKGVVLTGLKLRDSPPVQRGVSFALQLKEDQKKDASRWLRDYTVVDESAETLLTGPNSLYEACEHHCKMAGNPPTSHQGFAIWVKKHIVDELEDELKHDIKFASQINHSRYVPYVGTWVRRIKLRDPALPTQAGDCSSA